MKLEAIGKSHKGLVRRINEDSYFYSSELGLFVVADGMGGHKAGEVASRLAVDAMKNYWQKMAAKKPPDFLRNIDMDVSQNAKHLVNSIYFANSLVFEAQKKPDYSNMGTTISAVISDQGDLWCANVGDSPVLLYKDGAMITIFEEHSVEAEQKNLGLADDDMAFDLAAKNTLTRVLGLNEKVSVFLTRIDADVGDIIVICSDGLINYLPQKAIGAILSDSERSIEQKAEVLIDEANRGGGGDNITVILIKILEEGKWEKIKNRIISKM